MLSPFASNNDSSNADILSPMEKSIVLEKLIMLDFGHFQSFNDKEKSFLIDNLIMYEKFVNFDIPDTIFNANIRSKEDGCSAIDKLIDYELSSDKPFTTDELAELFKKLDTQRALGFMEGIQKALQGSDIAEQAKVDDYITKEEIFKKEFNSPFTEKELAALFQPESWGAPKGSREYNALTPEEKQYVDQCGWTPKASIHKDTQTRDEHRFEMKNSVRESRFEFSKLLVLKHNHENKVFYFLAAPKSMVIESSRQKINLLKKLLPEVTSDRLGQLWLEVLKGVTVLGEKLRADQITYLEKQYTETLKSMDVYNFRVYFDKHFDCPEKYLRNYQLLSYDEKEILENLGLTPQQASCEIEYNPRKNIESRRRLKRSLMEKPFDFGINYTVIFKKGCYVIRSERFSLNTCLSPKSSIIVAKADLRLDQIEFLDKKMVEKKIKIQHYTVKFNNGCYEINNKSSSIVWLPTKSSIIVDKTALRANQIEFLDERSSNDNSSR